MTALQLIHPADVHGFESAAGAFLAAREAEHNLRRSSTSPSATSTSTGSNRRARELVAVAT